MEKRQIGRSKLVASRIGLGCVTFGREVDEQQSRRILDYAVSHGISFLDTSENYGGGNARQGRLLTYGTTDVREVSTELSSSEKILGRWLHDRGGHDDLVISTKVAAGAPPEAIDARVQGSLDRLQLDCIDVYKLHVPNPEIPIGETLSALDEQVNRGRIRLIGCSNFDASQLQEALDASRTADLARFEITQPPYSLANPSAEEALFPLCEREQIGITSYSPLAAGFLTGKYRPTETRQQFPKGSRFDVSPAHADVYFSDRNFRVVEQLRRKAAATGQSMAHLAMAWAVTQPQITAVLIGARTTEHIDNALAALHQGLTAAEREEMSAWD